MITVKNTSTAFITVIEADPEFVNGQVFNVGSDEQNTQIFNSSTTSGTAPQTEEATE